ncbi:MFS transporter, DHA1 family, bicyclomycin/chloramphenicol resistance protein [Paenibacillus sp. 1_12]|uniref:multidrug effflux MFS transporter n=1 Tax=Paenibacillus sp. 1_12 TaxID=1566278 RepID=UPI0008E373C1|nr:multidrug effflux MFS transporter [Paenibacillus sp. 1_12]SFL23225.1 MFS transporter, DHA1 family, bicyclomycin/chloramphenicol resistance protein [Paenibacillus sp. 1_12]
MNREKHTVNTKKNTGNTKKNRNQLRFALLLGTFSALGPFTIDMYLPSFPEIVAQFGTTASLVQLSLTACLLGLGLGQLVMGTLSDVHGRRMPLLICMILYLAASFTCAIAPNIVFFIVVRFIQGFAASAGIVISRAMVRDVYSGHELTKFFSLLMLVSNLAPLVAPVVGSGIISFTTWVGVFIALGLIGIFLSLMTTWKLDETLPVEKRVPSNFMQVLRNFKSLLKDPQFAGYALAQGIMIAGVFAYVSGTPFIYQNIYGASPQLFAILFGSNGISLIIGSQIVGRLTHRISERSFLLIGLLLAGASSAAVLIAALVHGPLFALVIPLFFFVASIGMTATASFSLAMEHQSHIAGSAAALLGLIPFILGAVVSPLVGIAGEHTAVPLGVIILLTSLIALLAYLGLVKRSSKELAG